MKCLSEKCARCNPAVRFDPDDPIARAGGDLLTALKLNLPADDDESIPLRVDLERLLARADRIVRRAP